MYFSKSFGYALRGILYVALRSDENRNIKLEEIATRLSAPRHFLGKIMKRLVKAGILISIKGPNGGFSISERTVSTKLISLVFLIDGRNRFERCVLHIHECTAMNPCPLHNKMEEYRKGLDTIITETTIGDMIVSDKVALMQSITNTPNLNQFSAR
jgi:Rrf2 family transcriptional regulator, iron-sulfur cluster assembly transcription factor